jgi:hypothetical protein
MLMDNAGKLLIQGGDQLFPVTEQSHYRKYLATLGVATIFGTLAVGGYLLQMPASVGTEESQIEKLPPDSQEILRQKNQLALTVIDAAPAVVIILLVIGILLFLYGIIGWRNRQQIFDQRENLERDKLAAELKQMSPADKEEKITEEAIESILSTPESGLTQVELQSLETSIDEGLSGGKKPEEEAPEPRAAPEEPSVDRNRRPSVVLRRHREEIQEIEKLLEEKLFEHFGQGQVVSGVQVSDGPVIHRVDFAIRSANSQVADYILEIKRLRYVTKNSSAIESAALQISSFQACLSGVRARSRQELSAVLILVVDAEEFRVAHHRIDRQLFRISRGLKFTPSPLIYTTQEFKEITSSKLAQDISIAGRRFRNSPPPQEPLFDLE